MVIEVGQLSEIAPGSRRIVETPQGSICVYNLGGELFALENRCTHDDGPLCDGELDAELGVVICPRHGAEFDVRSGDALTPPAYAAVETYAVSMSADGIVSLEL